MKANAPEKIYAYIPDDDIVGTASIKKGIPHQFVTTEYTRTDAFIDKAAGWLSDNTLSGLCLDLGNAEIVREFVDNFKNYMKGE